MIHSVEAKKRLQWSIFEKNVNFLNIKHILYDEDVKFFIFLSLIFKIFNIKEKNKKFKKNTLQSKNKVLLYITCDAKKRALQNVSLKE